MRIVSKVLSMSERRNMKRILMLGMFSLFLVFDALSESMSDEEILATLATVQRGGCDLDLFSSMYKKAIAACNGDKERLSRLFVRLAVEKPRCKKWAITSLSTHGTASALPFLYSQTNDVRVCESVAYAVVNIEGVTSNSIAIVNKAFKDPPSNSNKKYAICASIRKKALLSPRNSVGRNLAIENLKRYAKEIPSLAAWADEFVVSLDPQYENSDERMKILEEISEKNPHEFHRQHATNAVKRIKAFREKKESK